MPAKAGSITTEDVADAANDTAAKISADAQKAIAEAAKRIEAAVQQGLEQAERKGLVGRDLARAWPTTSGLEFLSDLQAHLLPDA